MTEPLFGLGFDGRVDAEVLQQSLSDRFRMTALRAVVAVALAGICVCGGRAPSKTVATINQAASLRGELPENPLAWRVISASVDTKNATMSTLYGNDAAVQYARSSAQHNYPSGATVSLVTWTQQEDDRWFGAKIANQVKSVEFVFVRVGAAGKPSYSYQVYGGTPLKKASEQETAAPNDRATELLSLRAAVLP
jgi:hypothetical protein